MKPITKFLIGLLFPLYIITFSSCSNYLEYPLMNEFNEDSVFTRRVNVEKFLSQMYAYNVNKLPFGGERLDRSMLDACSDIGSGLYLASGYGAHKINKGTAMPEWLSNNTTGEDVFSYHYKAIRMGWKLLERTDEVPDATTAQKNRIKADAKTLIAMHYFELMKRYGGVPLVKKAFNSPNESIIQRSPIVDVYKYIVQLCDEIIAAPDFPIVLSRNDLGHTSKALAFGLKAKTLLFAASPLFNNDRPYMDNFGANNNLICMMPYNKELWKDAADAYLTAIDSCEAAGLAITDIGDVDKNYTAAYLYAPSKGNTELIMVYMAAEFGNYLNWYPRGIPMNGYSSNVPTFNYVEMFQTKDGNYRDWDTDTITPVNDPTYPYKNLDARFKQIICYNGMEFYPGVTLAIYDDKDGKKTSEGRNGSFANAQFAHYNHKYIVGFEDRIVNAKTWRPMTVYMRLTELYLSRAEALNEYYDAPVQEVFDRLDFIRNRSGMPPLDQTRIKTKEQMREQIKKERAIELGWEDSRYFDLKRWKMGENFRGPIWDLKVRKLANNKYTYKKYIYENRYWSNHYYLHPFPPSEVNKQYGLIQNPGW